MNEYQDKEILDLVLGGIVVRDMTALTFLQWISGKINGMPAYKAASQELTAAVSSPPMSRLMPDDEKIRLVRKLLTLDIPVP